MSDAKFGEPWKFNIACGWVEDLERTVVFKPEPRVDENEKITTARAIACVNVFEGTTDPEAELARLRKIEKAANRTSIVFKNHNRFYQASRGHDKMQDTFDVLAVALRSDGSEGDEDG